MKAKDILANIIVKWYKRLGICGFLRFRTLMLAYKLFPAIGARYEEWKFVLNYLFPLTKEKDIYVLDVGASSSLFIYELDKRGYNTYGIDQRPYQEDLPVGIVYCQLDVTDMSYLASDAFDFVTCISTIEHIGLGEYGGKQYDEGDKKAVKEMHRVLKPEGKLLITTHTKVFAKDLHPKGYTYKEFIHLVGRYFDVAEYTERKGQICACCVKKCQKDNEET